MAKDKDLNGSKIFKSPYKDEIEKRLALGQSPRAISKWLETRGEKISYQTINEYKNNFFNVDAEAGKLIKQTQKRIQEQTPSGTLEEIEDNQRKLMESEMNMHLAKVRAVNHIQVLYDNIQQMREYIMQLKNYEPVIASHAARGLFQEIRATIETLEKIKERDNEGNDSSVARLLSGLKKQKKEMEKIVDADE